MVAVAADDPNQRLWVFPDHINPVWLELTVNYVRMIVEYPYHW